MQQRRGAIELRLRLTAARDREIDLSEFLGLVVAHHETSGEENDDGDE
jgi:hypothetical protein